MHIFRICRAGLLGALCAASAVAQAQGVTAVAETGNADAGIASKPIASVATNDTVNGSRVILGASGNAKISKVGTWPSGMAFNPSTGAVSTTAAMPAGTYSVQYRLCDNNTPPTCATTTDTIAVNSASILPLPDSGTADAGIASTAIADVAANDTINGVPAALGTSGNATVASIGAWPAGIVLDLATGSVSTTATVPVGVYSVRYRLCDLNMPPVCAVTTITLTVATIYIVPVVDSGTADVGVASKPIVNVAANDTINDAAAVIGPSGNAAISKVGTWPAGINLNTATGAVTTSALIPIGKYSFQYGLCDLNNPPACITTTDSVSVISTAVIAIADAGSAFIGTAATVNANVAANDSVNGSPATLGTAGNAIVMQAGTWPGGLALATTTGAVTTTSAVPAGNYSLQYRLCDKNMPPVCATTTDTVSIVTPSIIAVPDSGNAATGVASVPIANVAANDSVNGAPATLGPSGNAIVAQAGAWPADVVLSPTTGAVATTAAVPPGTYSIQYQLCDLNVPVHCATATDTLVVAPLLAEVPVTPVIVHDIEFDWGRDGIYCATCNYGQGNARFNWTDNSGNLWVGHVDPTTGAFTPVDGNNELADTSAFYFATFSNGPEWGFSTQNGEVTSQLVYTRHTPGMPALPANAGAAFAGQTAAGWSANFFPGAIGPLSSGGAINTVLPQASQCKSDPVALATFTDLATPQNVYGELTTTAPGTAPVLMPFGAYATSVSGDKPAIRWVACTHQLVFIGTAPADPDGNVFHQLYSYDSSSQKVRQLTTDAADHAEGFMFRSPEFSGSYVFYTVTNNVEIDVYEQTGIGADGTPSFQLVNQITSPDPAEPYINGTEPFIHCAPTCQTYIFMKLQPAVRTPANIKTLANGLAVTNISPAQRLFKILAPAAATPTVQRNDAEYYITAKGPYLYYSRRIVPSATAPAQAQGRYFIDMQLGAPSGPCVGSSAEGGMMPAC